MRWLRLESWAGSLQRPSMRVWMQRDCRLENTQATEYLRDHLGPADVVLIKGSHGMRMDRIVAALECANEQRL